jgi:parallel beta-helix repeat protein
MTFTKQEEGGKAMRCDHKTRKRQKFERLIFCVLMGLSGLAFTGGFFPAKAEVSCGDTIGPNDKVTLQADLGPCTGDFALKVIGPATLNLNGHKVTRTVNQKEIGIWVTENNAKVLNGIVMGFKWGFKVDGDGNHLAHNIATNNKKGFTVDGDRNRLDGNTAFNNTNENYQIRGDKNWLADNSAYGGDEECFLIDGGNMNWLLNNVAIVGG